MILKQHFNYHRWIKSAGWEMLSSSTPAMRSNIFPRWGHNGLVTRKPCPTWYCVSSSSLGRPHTGMYSKPPNIIYTVFLSSSTTTKGVKNKKKEPATERERRSEQIRWGLSQHPCVKRDDDIQKCLQEWPYNDAALCTVCPLKTSW